MSIDTESVPQTGLRTPISEDGVNGSVVSVLYTNYRGETAVRQILPQRIWFGATSWHPEPGWLLDAIDVEKNVLRSFAMKDIKAWFTA